MTKTRKFSTLLISAMVLGAIVFAGGALSPNAPAAFAAQSNASCTTFIEPGGASGIQIPTKGTANTAANRNCLLGQGNQGNAVLALQLAVNYCYGKSTNGIDAIFGPGTKAGLKDVQGIIGTTKDGVYGNNTHNKIKFWAYTTYKNGKAIVTCYADSTKV
ncbi:MAG: peptidoglycan-binding protein [Bifidobacteriaceae bacterium]|jgi:hypothetical protein|nr:peptidoglycan-binding protein [Bifidobacteriaceae bacterium]